jgi:hypothetical protein
VGFAVFADQFRRVAAQMHGWTQQIFQLLAPALSLLAQLSLPSRCRKPLRVSRFALAWASSRSSRLSGIEIITFATG